MTTQKVYCSHRGFNTIAPENSVPAFATAIALGAQEIELDLWPSKDGEIIVCHDSTIDRTTNGTGRIIDLTKEEIMTYDAGKYFSPYYAGLKLPLFEDVLKQFGQKVTMNIHIKSLIDNPYKHDEMKERGILLGKAYREDQLANLDVKEPTEKIIETVENRHVDPYDRKTFEKIVELIYKYNCQDSVYITGEKDVLMTALEVATEIKRCCLEGHMNYTIVKHAIEYKCSRVQFCKHFVTKRLIEEAKSHGLVTNLFWSNNYEEANHFLENGIDVILTDNFLNTVVGK